jgi:hypothetical protein
MPKIVTVTVSYSIEQLNSLYSISNQSEKNYSPRYVQIYQMLKHKKTLHFPQRENFWISSDYLNKEHLFP